MSFTLRCRSDLVRVISRPCRAFIDINKPLRSVFGITRKTDIDHTEFTIEEISAKEDMTAKLAREAYTHTLQLATTVNSNLRHINKMIKDLHSEVLMIFRKEQHIEKNYFLLSDWKKTLHKFLSLYISADMQMCNFNR